MYHSTIKTTQKESSVIVSLPRKVTALGIKGRVSRFSACASDDLSAVKIIVFRPIRCAFTTLAWRDTAVNCYNLLSIVYEMTGQPRLPLVVEVIPAFKIELAHVQS